MKNYIILFYLMLIGFSSGAQSSAIRFNNAANSWNEIVQIAKKLKKPIFVDVYTVWCGPCKKMDQEVFVDKSVGTFYNSNFINVKIDAEKGWGKDFARQNQVNGYPTYLYFNEKGEELVRSLGYAPPEPFLKQGQHAVSLHRNRSKTIFAGAQLDSIYRTKKYTNDFLYKYIKYEGKIQANRCDLIDAYLGKLSEKALLTDSVLNFIYSYSGDCLIKQPGSLLQGIIAHYKAYPVRSVQMLMSPYHILRTKLEQVIDSTEKSAYKPTESLIQLICDTLYPNAITRQRQQLYYNTLYAHGLGNEKEFIAGFKSFCTQYITAIDTSALFNRDLAETEAMCAIEKQKNPDSKSIEFRKGIETEALQTVVDFITLYNCYRAKYKDADLDTKLKDWALACMQLYRNNPVYVNLYYLGNLQKISVK